MAISSQDQLVKTTVRLEVERTDGTRARGTAFFYAFAVTGAGAVTALVTNRHLLEDTSRLWFHATLQGPDGEPTAHHFPCQLEGLDPVFHPDPKVDLAALPVGGLLEHAQQIGRPIYSQWLSERAMVPDNNVMTPIEEVLMVGYPTGLWDSVHNRPITRCGTTATDPRLDFEGRPEFLIDVACYPGSSGSPVFLYNRIHPTPETGVLLGSRIAFLGVLYGGPQFTADGRIEVVTVPTGTVPMSRTSMPMNLGCVLHARKVSDLEPIITAKAGTRDANA